MPDTTPLRILHLANSLSDYGNGIVNVAVDLAMEEARRGFSVTFASEGGGFAHLLESAGVRCVQAPQSGMSRTFANTLRLLRILRSMRPAILHVHMRSGLALTWPWARLLGIPVVMHLHNIHDRSYGLVLLPDRVIAVSKAVGNELLRQKVPARRIRVVLNGTLGSLRREPAEGPPASLKHPALVTVGGVSHRKGIAELIDAFARISSNHPQAHLYVVGHATGEEFFHNLARQSGAGERIHFEGFQADPRPYLRAADIFVLASRRESFGLAILEARQAGCAIIATNVDGVPELLDNGRCGLLVPPRDAAGLANQIDRLLRNPDLQQALRNQAQLGLERFTVGRMTTEVIEVYQELLAGRPSRSRASS